MNIKVEILYKFKMYTLTYFADFIRLYYIKKTFFSFVCLFIKSPMESKAMSFQLSNQVIFQKYRGWQSILQLKLNLIYMYHLRKKN